MKLFFITIFRKTFLLACFLTILYHVFYFDIYDFPYLLIIKIAQLIIWVIEVMGMILYLKYDHTYLVKKRKKANHTLFKSYITIRLLFYYSFVIYIFLPKGYMLLNFLIILLFGIYLGYRMAIKESQRLDREP